MTSRLAVMGRMAKVEAGPLCDYHERRCDTGAESDVYECLSWLAGLYVSRGKAIIFYRCTLFFFRKVISEVTKRIPLILSHNIRSGSNLILHPRKLVGLSPQKNHPKPPKIGISETEFDIRWRITLQRNFASTIAAVIHYEGPSPVNAKKRVNFGPKMRD